MNRGAVKALAFGQIVTAAILVLVALFGVQSSREVQQLRADLGDTRQRLAMVENERDQLRERVSALEAALVAAGVDPKTVQTAPSAASEPSEPAVAPAPAGRETPAPRPAETQPPPPPQQPPRQPSPTPSPSPSPEPSTCVLTVCLPL